MADIKKKPVQEKKADTEIKTASVDDHPIKPTGKTSSSEMKTAVWFGSLTLSKIRTRPGKFKREKELEEAEQEIKKIKGMKAKKTQTIFHKGIRITIVKGYPVPKQFTDLFNEDQLDNYFE